MAGKYGNIWVWFFLIIDAIFVAMLIILFRFKVIGIKWFFITLITMIITFIVLFLVQIIGIFNYNEDHAVQNQKKPVSNMFKHRTRINQFLSERPNGDVINWDGGRYGREELKVIETPHGDKEFYGVTAMLRHNRTWVVIIYSVEKKDIVKYVADPSPDQLTDPFHGFSFFDKGKQSMSDGGFGRNDYQQGGQHFHLGGGQEARRREGASRAKNASDRAYETLKRSGGQ